MPRKGYSPEKILNKLRQVEVAVASGKRIGQAVREIGVTDHTHSASLRAGSEVAQEMRIGHYTFKSST